jgi:hypothetical protein
VRPLERPVLDAVLPRDPERPFGLQEAASIRDPLRRMASAVEPGKGVQHLEAPEQTDLEREVTPPSRGQARENAAPEFGK